jgi:hypothetical protein
MQRKRLFLTAPSLAKTYEQQQKQPSLLKGSSSSNVPENENEQEEPLNDNRPTRRMERQDINHPSISYEYDGCETQEKEQSPYYSQDDLIPSTPLSDYFIPSRSSSPFMYQTQAV